MLPLLLLLLFGIIDFGLALNKANTDTNIANLAVRKAALIGTATTASCHGSQQSTLQAWATCQTGASPGTTTVCVEGGPTYTVGNPITVDVSSQFDWASVLTGNNGYIGKVVSPTSTFTSHATMRMEQSPSSSATSGTNTFLNQCA